MSIITPQFCDVFRKDFATLVKSLEEKHGVKVELGKITYDPGVNFTAKLTVSENDADKKLFERYCGLFDLDESDYGAAIIHKGESYTLVGLELKRSKFPIILEHVKTKKRILITEEGLKAKLKK